MSAIRTRIAARTAVFLTLAAGWTSACREAPAPPPASGATSTAERRTADLSGDALPTDKPLVYFGDLKPFLPDALEGFAQVAERGSTGKYGAVLVSEAERSFRDEQTESGREITVRIVDTSMSGRLGASIKAAVRDAAARPRSDPTAPIQLRDALGFVRYDPDEEQAEANLLVGDRYVVAVTTRGFQSTSEARRIARNLDLEGLAQLR